MITPENADWLLGGSIVGTIILVCVLMMGFWPEIRRLQFRNPVILRREDSWVNLEKPSSAFHEDRDALTKAEGTLKEQIEKTEHVWISCFTASTLEQSPVLSTHKITKLVLYNPTYSLLDVYAAMEGDVNKVTAYQNNIISSTEEALENNIPVYWVSRPLINLMIANAETTKKDVIKWAKIETFIPLI